MGHGLDGAKAEVGRIRTIKPEFWTDERLSALPEATHLLAAALLNYSDDEGYFNANSALIKAACSPLREPSVSIDMSLEALSGIGYLRLISPLESGGAPQVGQFARQFGVIVNFTKHQKTNRAKPSRIKTLLESLTSQWPVSDDSVQKSVGTGNREQGTGEYCGDDATAQDDSENGSGTAVSYPQAFEEFWLAYPTRGGRKRGKSKCLGIWRQAIRMAERQPLVEAAKHYAASDESTRGFARDPERFLAKDWWRDWIPAIAELPPERASPPVPAQVPHRIPKANFK